MSEARFAVTGVGNALVDVLSQVEEEHIAQYHMTKGIMQLVDETRAVELYASIEPEMQTSGGSAANTMAGLASFGGRCGYIGKVADDMLGTIFSVDMKEVGVHYNTEPLMIGAQTGRCLIFVTPDAHRTMNTYLGASIELGPKDIDADLIASSQITFLEGYLFDPEHAKQAFIKAADIAHEAGHRVALSLSDPFCVERHREDFKALIEHHIDLLFANEEEIKHLYHQDNFEDAVQIISGKCEVAALTRSEKGSVIITPDEQIIIDAEKVRAVDTTGAGDQYAAGFLYGWTEGMPLDKCGKLATMAASEVITHMGPRPETPYKEFLRKLAA